MKKVMIILCILVGVSISTTRMDAYSYRDKSREDNTQREYSSKWPTSTQSRLASDPIDRTPKSAAGDADIPGGTPILCEGIGTVCTCGCQTGGTCTCGVIPVDPIEDAVWFLLLMTGVYGIFLFAGSNKISFRRLQ
jgi:hypothetical protein